MKLSLLVLTPGKMEGKTLDIKLSQFVIGRDPQCHLRPASPLISKRHCAILIKENKAFIRDFDSTNGTLVNEEPIDGECELHHDDRLKIGPLLFSVRMVADAPAPTKTPSPAPRPATAGKTPPPATRPAGTKPPASTPAPAGAVNPGPVPAVTAKAPVPESKSPAASSGGSNEDDVMAMLLDMQDDSSTGEVHRGPDGVPDGSTVMDLKIPEAVVDAAKKDDQNKKEQKKADSNTQSAAASILEKMMKRPRA